MIFPSLSTRVINILALMVLFFSGAPALFALSVERMTIDGMSARSHMIVVGKVLDAASHRDARSGVIYTTIQVRVNDVLKGSEAEDIVSMKVPGGIVGKMGMYVEGATDFFQDEEVLLFLGRRPDSSLYPMGYGQGKFEIYTDSRSKMKVVTGSSAGRGQFIREPRPATVEADYPGEFMTLDQLRLKITNSATRQKR